MNPPRPGILMVTGAYLPEMSGAGLQCASLVRELARDADFCVLTTTADRSLPIDDVRDGTQVLRVFVDPRSLWSKAIAAARFTRAFLRISRRVSIVHFHGFSQKSILLVLLALMSGKRIALKLTSFGDDDPVSMRRRGALTYWCYRRAHVFFAVSPRFTVSYADAGLPAGRLRVIANGVDLQRFRPPAPGERESIRRELGIAAGARVILFVGFFSHDKRPTVLFDVWRGVEQSTRAGSVLVFVGTTQSSYHEVDPALASAVRNGAAAAGLASQVRFIEQTDTIEQCYRAADLFILPSVREGLPNALLEAMATGVACVATRISGVTDAVIDDGRNGLLVPVDDADALERAMRRLLDDAAAATRLGAEARRTIEMRYSLSLIAQQYLGVYRQLLQPCAA